MGIWSSIKNAVKRAAKTVYNVVKRAARSFFRAILAVVFSFVINIWDSLLGFLNWPPKNLTLHIIILSDNKGPLVQIKDLSPSIEYARRVLKDRLNITLRSYSRTFVDILNKPAPDAALNVNKCTPYGIFRNLLQETGDFFTKHTAGWNAVPISLRFPITVFIIKSIDDGYDGCSAGLFSDYVVVTKDGIEEPASTMMHEIGHSCNIFGHGGTNISDLMYANSSEGNKIRGDKVRGWQRNLIRSSRHVTYW